MKTSNTISTKIRMLGMLFVILMSSVIGTTIYLNAKNEKDALIINIAGKQRMLTQKISKNIFYLYHNNQQSYAELDNATQEFIYNLNSLKEGNRLMGISKVPTDTIANQIAKVEILWKNFYLNVSKFKELLSNRNATNENRIKNIVDTIYNTNIPLLQEVDEIVSLYTTYSEEKTDYIRNFQYIFGIMIIFLMIYSFIQLKAMELNAKKFLAYSKKITGNPLDTKIEPLEFEAETEIVEATDTLNCFITKVNSAMDYSNSASKRLEEITSEFDLVLGELHDSQDVTSHLDKSEDMVIESQENLLSLTNKLQELKKELTLLTENCRHT